MTLKAALANVVLSGFTLDGGEEHESFAAETVSERLALLMAIDRVDLSTVTAMLEANPALAKVRYYTEDSPADRCQLPHAQHGSLGAVDA